MTKTIDIKIRDMRWFKQMTLNASMPKFSIKLAKYVRFRIWLGLKLIRLGCFTLGINYTFQENDNVIIE